MIYDPIDMLWILCAIVFVVAALPDWMFDEEDYYDH